MNLKLLSLLGYLEARGESNLGILAVYWTVKNRLDSPKTWWGNNMEDIILFPYQYSCFNNGIPDTIIPLYHPCETIADLFLNDLTIDPTKGATHYHNLSVNPHWKDSLEFKVQIGNHLFYRED